jgi:hypothetical protein
MKKRLCIVHFQPLEKYPPVVNFIRFIQEQNDPEKEIHVVSIHPGTGKNVLEFPGVRVHRLGTWKDKQRIARLFFYIFFNIRVLLLLLRVWPGQILYYETLSAFGPWVYKRIFNKRVRLFIHYHEYTSPAEYESGMVLGRWLYKKEKQIYQQAEWVSHTNEERMAMFLQDVKHCRPLHTYILPNYPPVSWQKRATQVQGNSDSKIGFVYVGALSMETMYAAEMALFIAKHPESCYWHIYSGNPEEQFISFLQNLKASNIHFKGAIAYDELPAVLPAYDIGVILYKGTTPNFTYNAPNKFFEYLICGLNVWYPLVMKGMVPFEQLIRKPWVKGINFEDPHFPNPQSALRGESIPVAIYTAEKVYGSLYRSIWQ